MIHVGWNVDFDLPDLEDSINTGNSELTTITSTLPTTATSSIVTNSQSVMSVCPPTSSRTSKVCKAYQADSYIYLLGSDC